MKKFTQRALPSIQLNSQDNSAWENSFIDNLQQTAKTHSDSIYEEISAILGNTKPRYSSMSEAIDDMRNRSGLAALLDAKKALAFIKEPKIFQEIPQMKVFIDNFVSDRPGTSIENVVNDLLKINDIKDKLPANTDIDDEVKAYINERIVESSAKTDHNDVNMDLGKITHNLPLTSDDPFDICEPTKQK